MPPRHEVRRGGNSRNVGIEPGQIAREVVAALAEANMLNQTPRANAGNQNFEVVREFLRLDPPKFYGNSSDHLEAYHWLSEICKCFEVLAITEDSVRVRLVACRLGGEANVWWKSVLGERRDARRAARMAQQVSEPDVEDLTWVEFERLFEDQYFPESCRDQLREEFEQLEQGEMIVSVYAIKFQTLSRFAPELVATEERKCRRFEKGLNEWIKKLVMGQRIKRYSEIVELARRIENLSGKEKEVREWESNEQVKGVGSSRESPGDPIRKRQRESSQSLLGQQSRGPPISSEASGISREPRVICFKCRQPGHVRSQCNRPPKSCHRCGQLGHLERNCPQRVGRRN